MTAFQAEGCGGGFAASFIKKPARPHPRHFDRSGAEWRNLTPQMTEKPARPIPVISTAAERSGEISPSDGTGGITAGDLSTQSIIKAFSICPIPTRSSARDDGGDEQYPVISEGDEPHSRHFDRSEAEWRNLTPQMTEKPARALPSFRP